MSLTDSRIWLAALAMSALLLTTSTAQAQKLEQAVNMAQQTGRPILLLCTATWCGPCQELKQRFATEPALQELASQYVCVNLDIDADEREFQMWQTRYPSTTNGIPKVYIVSAQGQELYNGGAFVGDGLNRLLTEKLQVAQAQMEEITQAQLAEARARGGAQGGPVQDEQPAPFGQGIPQQGAQQPFGQLQEAEEEEPVQVARAEEPEEEPAEEAAPAREEPADEDPDTDVEQEGEDEPEETLAQLNRRLNGYLQMARVFAENQPAKAREYAQRVLDTAPSSQQAREARTLLDELD